MAGFKAGFDKLGADAHAAMTSVTDQASFGKALGTITKNCGTCHETYRIKRASLPRCGGHQRAEE